MWPFLHFICQKFLGLATPVGPSQAEREEKKRPTTFFSSSWSQLASLPYNCATGYSQIKFHIIIWVMHLRTTRRCTFTIHLLDLERSDCKICLMNQMHAYQITPNLISLADTVMRRVMLLQAWAQWIYRGLLTTEDESTILFY